MWVVAFLVTLILLIATLSVISRRRHALVAVRRVAPTGPPAPHV